MLRAFFLPEFKRSLLQKLLIVVPALVLLLMSEWLLSTFGFSSRSFGTPDFVIDNLVWVLMVLSGFVSGGAAFSRINERHLPFIHSLPISRLEVWTGLTTVHFTTSLLMVPVVLAMRPSLWRLATEGSLANGLAVIIPLYVVLFGAGACFVMLFRTIVIATPIGALITGSCLAIAALFSRTIDFDWSGYHRVYGVPVSDGAYSATLSIAACLLLALLYLGLSLRFFVKGELNLPGRRIRNWVVIGVAFVIYPLVLSAVIETGAIGSNNGQLVTLVSTDGKYLAVLEPRQDWGFGWNLSIIDTETGAVTGNRSLYGVIDAEWSRAVPVLNVTTMQSPLWRLAYVLPPSDSILRLSAEGKVVDRVRMASTVVDNTIADRPGRLLVSGMRGNRSKLFSLDDNSTLSELVDAPRKDSVRLERLQYRLYFLVQSVQNGLERSWAIEETAREISYSPKDKARAEGTILFDDGWYSTRAAGLEFARRFPLDSKIQTRVTSDTAVSYLVSPLGRVAVPNEQAFAILTSRTSGERTLLAFSKQTGWRALGDLSTLRNSRTTSLPAVERGFSGGEILMEGLVLFRRKGTQNLTLYDGKLDRTLELTGEQPGGMRALLCGFPQRVRSLEGAYMSCAPNSFFYRANGEIVPIAMQGGTLLDLDEPGRKIVRGRDGDVIRLNPDGSKRKLWPVR